MLRTFIFMVTLLCLLSSGFAQSVGESLFTAHCISCHGGDLSGKTNFGKKANIPDLRSAQIQNQTDKQLFDSIGHGLGHKEYPHAFLSRGFTNDQIKDLIAYIRSMKMKK